MSAWLALAAPPRAPELNGQEKYFKSFDDIVDHCCYVWITLIDLSRGKSWPSRAAMANSPLSCWIAPHRYASDAAPSMGNAQGNLNNCGNSHTRLDARRPRPRQL